MATTQDAKANRVAIDAALKQAEAIIRECTRRKQLFDAAMRCWKALMDVQAAAADFSKLDKAVQLRLKAIDDVRSDKTPAPRFEQGHYVAPTPPIGTRVLWRAAGDPKRKFGADVVDIEGPGRVQLKIIKPKNDASAFPDHSLGVSYIADPQHDVSGNPNTINCGVWEYMPGTKIPEFHFTLALDTIHKRVETCQRAVRERVERERVLRQEEKLAQALEG